MPIPEPVWTDPPPPKRRSPRPGGWALMLAPCLERPGEWALVNPGFTKRRNASRAAAALRSGVIQIPAGRWEFIHGEHGERFGVWARWLGP